MNDDLVTRLRDAHVNSPQRIMGSDIFAEAAARIESDAATIARLTKRADAAEATVRALSRFSRDLESRVLAAEAKVAALVEALEAMRRAVCGETGFAECVRRDSGKAYPWPALDAADEAARAALAAAKEAK